MANEGCNFCGGRGKMVVDCDDGESRVLRCVCEPDPKVERLEAAAPTFVVEGKEVTAFDFGTYMHDAGLERAAVIAENPVIYYEEIDELATQQQMQKRIAAAIRADKGDSDE